jgi:hypothetical protein
MMEDLVHVTVFTAGICTGIPSVFHNFQFTSFRARVKIISTPQSACISLEGWHLTVAKAGARRMPS